MKLILETKSEKLELNKQLADLRKSELSIKHYRDKLVDRIDFVKKRNKELENKISHGIENDSQKIKELEAEVVALWSDRKIEILGEVMTRNQKLECERASLLRAAINSHIDVFKIMLDNATKKNPVIQNSRTPLHEAALKVSCLDRLFRVSHMFRYSKQRLL